MMPSSLHPQPNPNHLLQCQQSTFSFFGGHCARHLGPTRRVITRAGKLICDDRSGPNPNTIKLPCGRGQRRPVLENVSANPLELQQIIRGILGLPLLDRSLPPIKCPGVWRWCDANRLVFCFCDIGGWPLFWAVEGKSMVAEK